MKTGFQFDPAEVQWLPEDYCERMNPATLFPLAQPLQVDVGCGDGAFLKAMAERFPECNFLGIERLLGRIRKCSRKMARAGLRNVRVLRLESHYTARWLLPVGATQVVHLSFPDPWPKRKHLERRLVNPEFVEAVHGALCTGGEFRITTDHAEYFQQMRATTGAHAGLEEMDWPEDPHYPQTDFERGFRERGLPIYRVRFRKTSPLRNDSTSNPSA